MILIPPPNVHRTDEARLFAERLLNALRSSGHKLSASYLAFHFNQRYTGKSISIHTARNWMLGISIPKNDKLQVLSQWLKVDPKDLLFGPDSHSIPTLLAGKELTLTEIQMLKGYLSLPPSTKFLINELVSAFVYKNKHFVQIKDTSK